MYTNGYWTTLHIVFRLATVIAMLRKSCSVALCLLTLMKCTYQFWCALFTHVGLTTVVSA